jgi:ATP-dependent helicase HrpB
MVMAGHENQLKAKIPLPIEAVMPQVLEAAATARQLVLVAPPGAGKTTRVPPALLGARLLDPRHPALLLLQPRRVAARAASARIAQENGWRLGGEVGYQVRFERRAGSDTRLLVLTEGILTRRLAADPFLEGIGGVVLDEFHERSLHTDLALALLREVRETVRPDLLLVVMSATLEAEPVAGFLGGCPVISAHGRSFPIEIQHAGASQARLDERVAEAVARVVRGAKPGANPGDLLVFLPGWEEIRRAARRLEPLARAEGLLVLPMHGRLDTEDQDRALRPADRRKVILATNVAETSLTIEGVGTVIDSGLVRLACHDPVRGLDRLVLRRVSRASATQRAGRAGRTGPGLCIRLWPEREERGLEPFDPPEVRRADLCATVLALRAWGKTDLGGFGWFEKPPSESLDAAERLLAALGALEPAGGTLTPLGRDLLALPVHPRLGRLLLDSAHAGCLRHGAALAALLSEPDILRGQQPNADGGRGPAAKSKKRGSSDLFSRRDSLEEAERQRFAPALRDHGIYPSAARNVARVRNELLRLAARTAGFRDAGVREPDEETLLKLVLVAYPDRLARRRAPGGATGVMVGGRGVRLDEQSVVRDSEFFLALDPREERRSGALEARVRIASAVKLEWLEDLLPGLLRRERSLAFDEDRQRVVALQRTWFRDLLVREDRGAQVNSDEASRLLAASLQPRAAELFEADRAASAWLARVAFLRKWLPERDWPPFDDPMLAEILQDVCAGKQSLEELRREPLLPHLQSRLSFEQSRLLATAAPEAITVPSQSRIRLTYSAEGPPILAVRLQELFGLSETPTVALGRVRVLLHLLGPHHRPVQITHDLHSFWSTTYFQVRKDLRARYPKHSWPDDPLTAHPEAKGGRKPP